MQDLDSGSPKAGIVWFFTKVSTWRLLYVESSTALCVETDKQTTRPAVAVAVAAAMEGTCTPLDEELYESSLNGNLEGVMAALGQGGRVTVRNSGGFTPLLVAAFYGHKAICGLLLAFGSNVNEVVPATKATALHLAAGSGHNDIVEALLSCGAEVNAQDCLGATPIFSACQYGHLTCVLTLLKAGASISLSINDGMLPIHIAAKENKVAIVSTFLEHGCSPDVVS